jgi:hypothetical protein
VLTSVANQTNPTKRRGLRLSSWRREALRTNLWFVPTLMVALAVALFVLTYLLDRAATEGRLTLPGWVASGSADTARQILIGIAAAIITVAGVVFSITILALQLASQQFGPRMLRNFIRDFGTQASLGAFVATFTYAVLTLASVGHLGSTEFVPHLSVTTALGLTLIDLGVLIYFIHHVAYSIQLTSVVAGIAGDFRKTLRQLLDDAPEERSDNSPAEVRAFRGQVGREGVPVAAATSGFLQAIGHDRLVRIAGSSDARISLLNRPGQFVVEGQALAIGWPAQASAAVSRELARAHIVGPSRTLAQDPRVCHRSTRRGRDQGALAGGQRHLHGAQLPRLAGRLSLPGSPAAPATRRLSRPPGARAPHRAGNHARLPRQACVRQDSPGGTRDAGSAHPATGESAPHHASPSGRPAFRRHPRPSGDDHARNRRVRPGGVRPLGREGRLRGSDERCGLAE